MCRSPYGIQNDFGCEPQVIEQNVSLVDLFPTLCDLVDIPAPDEIDGRSLMPHSLKGPLMTGTTRPTANSGASTMVRL